MARASSVLLGGFAEELRSRGTSLPIWCAVAALSAEPGQTVGGLAEACLLQRPTMAKLLDRMERDGLVALASDAQDRRVARAVLTPEGKAEATALAAMAERHEAAILARYPGLDGIRDALRGIIAGSGSAAPPDAWAETET